MSIINKMLQDLDTRNGRPGGEAVDGGAIRSVKQESPWKLGRNTLILLAGLAGAALAAGWWLQQRKAVAESPRVVVPAPAVPVLANAVPPAVAPSAPTAPATTAAAASATLPAAPPKAVAEATTPAKALAQNAGPAPAAPPRVAAAPAKPDNAAAARPVAAANASNVADKTAQTAAKAEPAPPLPKAAAANPKATGGKTYSPGQVAANWLAEAVALDQQGRQEEAKAPLQRALAANPLDVPARQMLAQLQLDTHHVGAASELLAEGQRLLPDQPAFSLALARLKADAGDVKGAIQTLEAGRGGARDEPQYRAFLAALLLRVERYDEAVQHYLVALRSDPANTSWLVGVGVALEGVGKPADAAEAYRRAGDATNLSPDTARFLSERLARLRP